MKTRKYKTKRRGGVRKNLTMNEKKNLRAILLYERYPDKKRILSDNTMTIGTRIEKLLDKQMPLTEPLIVWRGQSVNEIFPWDWLSTSLREEVAKSYTRRHVFKIHLQPGVKVLHMYNYYKQYNILDPVKEKNELESNYFQSNNYFTNNNYTQFGEVIVAKGGSFWQDAEKTKKGFTFIGFANQVDARTLKEEAEEIEDRYKLKVYETFYFPPESK